MVTPVHTGYLLFSLVAVLSHRHLTLYYARLMDNLFATRSFGVMVVTFLVVLRPAEAIEHAPFAKLVSSV